MNAARFANHWGAVALTVMALLGSGCIVVPIDKQTTGLGAESVSRGTAKLDLLKKRPAPVAYTADGRFFLYEDRGETDWMIGVLVDAPPIRAGTTKWERYALIQFDEHERVKYVDIVQCEDGCLPAETVLWATIGEIYGEDTAKIVVAQLLRHGRVRRGYIGVAGQNISLSRRLVRHLELPGESGVRVMSVEAGNPAQRAGMEEGDVIVQWDGVPVAGIDDLHRLLSEDYLDRSAEATVVCRAQRIARHITPIELATR